MKKALKATYLLAPLFFGFIIGSAIAENGMTWLWVALLILDAVVGIVLQRIDDEENGQTSAPLQREPAPSKADTEKTEKQSEANAPSSLSPETQAELREILAMHFEEALAKSLAKVQKVDEGDSHKDQGNLKGEQANMKTLKVIGIILIVMQVFSLIGTAAAGVPLFNGSLANLIGRFTFGIIGVILLVIAARKS